MTKTKAKWTKEQKRERDQLRTAADPNNTAQHFGQQQVLAGHDYTTDPPTQSEITWHAETRVSNEQGAAEVARVRIQTKTAYDALKAQGLSANKIMGQLLPGKTGVQFHATKMIVQAEKNKERATEFKMLFPEIPNVPNTLRQSDQNKFLKAAGYNNKQDMKYELAKRRSAKGLYPIDDFEEDGGVLLEPAQDVQKREHDGNISVGQPMGMLGIPSSICWETWLIWDG